MSSPRSKRSAIERARARGRERGAAVFIIVLVMTLLMGIGVFAARSASLNTQVSGHGRQSVQTHYVTEYATLVAASMLSSDKKAAYIKMATKPQATEICADQSYVPNAVLQRNCYKILYQAINQQAALQQVCGLVVPAEAPIPGSLGLGNTEADFLVELTDISPGPVPPGYNMNPGNQAPTFKYVSVTATGQVRLVNTGNPGLDPASGASSSTEMARALLVVGPLPPDI